MIHTTKGLITALVGSLHGPGAAEPRIILALLFVIPALATAMFFPGFALAIIIIAANLRTLISALPDGVTAPDVLLGLFLVGSVLRTASLGGIRPIPRWTLWLVGFFAWAWVSLLLAQGTGSSGITSLARITLYGAAFFAATQVRSAHNVLLAVTALAAVESILALSAVTPATHPGRPEGYLGDVHQFGLFVLLALPSSQLLRHKITRRLLLALFVTALAFTLTRSIWAAAIAEIAIIVFPRFVQRRLLVTAVAVGVVVLVAAGTQQEATQRLRLNERSLPLRQATWATGVETVGDSPILGAGWAYHGEVPGLLPTFNLWLNVAASTGIPGMLMFLAFYVSLLVALHRQRALGKAQNAVFIYIVGFAIVSLVEMTLYAAAPATITLFAVAGLAIGANTAHESRYRPRQVPAEPLTSATKRLLNPAGQR